MSGCEGGVIKVLLEKVNAKKREKNSCEEKCWETKQMAPPPYLMTGNSVYNLRRRSKAVHFRMKGNEEP